MGYVLLGILAHFIGDYLLQNDYLAVEKTRKTIPALIHVLLYSVPFFFILGFGYPLLVIAASHFLIDRFRLASWWIKLINWNFKSKNFGFSNSKPHYMSIWLMIIYDQIFHILINSIVIYTVFN